MTKFESLTDVALLEHCVRDALNKTSHRRMAVLRPLKLTSRTRTPEARRSSLP
jgi:glutaminyl-tRNA synthetase